MELKRIAIFLSYFKALTLGLLVGLVLVTSYVAVPELLKNLNVVGEGGDPFLTPLDYAQIAAGNSVLSGIVIELFSTPVWLLLGRYGQQSYWLAAVLGFAATLIVWIVLFQDGIWDREGLQLGLPYAICGALAGMVCWWKSPARPAQ